MPIRPRLPATKTPWPMKWIALAILVFVVPYTWLTLHYRKPGKAYEPYEDGKARANTARLVAAGWQRIEIRAERPADPSRWRATIDATAKFADASLPGLPADLATTFVEPPLLPKDFSAVTAAATAGARLPYVVLFTCTLPDAKKQLAGALVYVRADAIVLVPQFEPIQADLLARTLESPVLLTVPANTLKPGRYTVTLAGSARSQSWSLDVQ